jgi:hypothetical protein
MISQPPPYKIAMRFHFLRLAIIATIDVVTASLDGVGVNSGGSCDAGFTICAPPGATSATTPQIGSSDFQNLFVDIVESSLPASKRSLSGRSTASLCCTSSLSCLTMANLQLPFCYDQFTTNYYLPDGSYGTVVGGAYTSAAGDTANLETGNYTLISGQTGNIYSNNPAAKPNTATLPLPSQFTASGVGTAIPASALGGKVTVTYTTTILGSTIPASTIRPTTVPGAVIFEPILYPSTISTVVSNSLVQVVVSATSLSTQTGPASVFGGTTIPASTAAALVTTITTTEVTNLVASPTAEGSGSKNKNAAARTFEFDLWTVRGLLLILGAVLQTRF